MANFCENRIKIFCTENELNEIENVVCNDIVDLPATYDGWEFGRNEMLGTTAWGFDYECLLPLSKLFPSTLFHIKNDVEGFPEDGDDTVIIDGDENYGVITLEELGYDYEEGATYKIISCIITTVKRFLDNNYALSSGRMHKTVLYDGKVKAIGDNSFGQCNVSDWDDVVKISTGEFHTVALLKNGIAVATGSNVNSQCEVDKMDNIKDISCGRYHTAILFNDGTVKIAGELSNLSEFSNTMELLYAESINDEQDIVDGEKINEFISSLINENMNISDWKDIVKIKSIYDGIIAIDKNNKLYVCGNIGCDKNTLINYINQAILSDDENIVKSDEILKIVQKFEQEEKDSQVRAYQYEVLEDGTAEINEYAGKDTNIIIPKEIDGYTVTNIGERAFDGCRKLESVTIPETIKNIGDYAFIRCNNLKEINLANGVERIGDGAFIDCEKLSKINLPDSIRNIGFGAFNDCHSLTKINLPNSIRDIDCGAFEDCHSLTEIKLPNQLTKISEETFKLCENLISISIPNSINRIEYDAFSWCDNLSNIYFDGTEEVWNNIEIEEGNEDLENAIIHFLEQN